MDITAKLWSYCHILRHDGVDYADYIEQLTYLLFLKMADENEIYVPEDCKWQNLLTKENDELIKYYEYVLKTLKGESGILGKIFQEPISKIKNPKNLKKIIDGIESIGWTKLNKDVQGEAFEGLLEKTASEGKKGAGQFFTPRPLIQAIVNVMKPDPSNKKGFKVADTSCGTAGFLTVAVEWAKSNISIGEWNKVKDSSYFGQELVVRPYRLALMNLFLHGVNANLLLGDSIYSESQVKNQFDCILTNPPFGTRGIAGPPFARNFQVETSNLQLNFLQHIIESLKKNGRAAIVLPDTAFSESKAKEVWESFITKGKCNVHTILKLPKGTFNPYATGVKACVVFIQKGHPTKETWVFDARSNHEEINKSKPLVYEKHFAEFVSSYGSDPSGEYARIESPVFKKFSLKDISNRGFDLSFSTLKEHEQLNSPEFYVEELIESFERQLSDLKKLKEVLSK